MNMLGKAIALASKIHEDQIDKGGNAYILHPIRIMMRLRTSDEELMSIAILHDGLEDSKGQLTIAMLREMGFSERVLTALSLLTHDPSVPYDAYVQAIAANEDATTVKIEDLRDNSDITRLKGIRSKDFERVERYHRAYVFLSGVRKTRALAGYTRPSISP